MCEIPLSIIFSIEILLGRGYTFRLDAGNSTCVISRETLSASVTVREACNLFSCAGAVLTVSQTAQ
jgi:hypothetical protein